MLPRDVGVVFSVLASVTSLVPLALLAAGVSSLIEYALLVEPPLEPPPVVKANRASLAIPDTQAILRRNLFDSTTGPLDEVAEPVAPLLPMNLDDPLAAPSCEALSVYSTLESSDPYWSSAVIQGEHELRGSVRHPGDRVEGSQVLYIGFNPRLRSPCVWFLANGQLCQSALFDGKPRRGTPAAKPAPRAPKQPNARGRALPKSIADKIRRRSATEFDVDRGAVDAIFGDYSRLMRGTRVRPVNVDGKLVGLRLSGIRADSLLGQLGWRDGDQVQSINGFVLTSPDKALEAYARLRTADHLVVRVIRGGKQMSLDYRVR